MSNRQNGRGRGRGRGKNQAPAAKQEAKGPGASGQNLMAQAAPPSQPAPSNIRQQQPPQSTAVGGRSAASGGAAGSNGGGDAQKTMTKRDRRDSGTGLDRDLSSLSVGSSESSVEQPIYLAEKKPPGKRGKDIGTVTTNMYKIDLPKHMPVYRYEMQINAVKGAQMLDLCKNPRNDYYNNQKRKSCYAIFLILVRHPNSKDCFRNFYQMVYDRSRILYTLEKQMALHPQKEFSLEASAEGFGCTKELYDSLELDPRITSIQVVLKPADEFEMVMDNVLPSIHSDLLQRSRDLQQFLEVATNQSMFMNLDHVLFGNSSFANDMLSRDIGQGRYLVSGVKKSVRMVEGEKGDTNKGAVPVLQLDHKVSVFFKEQLVIDFLKEFLNDRQVLINDLNKNQWDLIQDQLKDLTVRTTHDPERKHTFSIVGLSKEHFAHLSSKINRDGVSKTMPLTTYFNEQYGIKLKYTRLPALIERSGLQYNYYPMELCRICENQRVDMMKQTPQQMQEMIRASALKPADRQMEVKKLEEQSNIIKGEHLKAMEIKIQPKTIQAPARQLPQPGIVYQGNRVQQPNVNNATWMACNRDGVPSVKFQQPASCRKWAGLILLPRQGRRDYLDDGEAEYFLKQFLQKCAGYGMQMGGFNGWSRIENVNNPSIEKMIDFEFQKWANIDVEYILVISPSNSVKKLHDWVKYYERMYDIVTQDMKLMTLQKVTSGRGRDILDKIVSKTNLKLGGRNYGLKLEEDRLTKRYLNLQTMYVGMDVNHPPPMSAGDRARGLVPREPSVVGMTANCGKDPLDLRGDYGFQDPRKEQMQENVITRLWIQMLNQFRKNRGSLPMFVVLYRDGFDPMKIVADEIPHIRKAFEIVYEETHANPPKLTVINLLKRHNIRLFPNQINPNDKAPFQNVKPGTVVDSVITHPKTHEFLLNSHVAIQGTAKTPLYQVVLNEVNMATDDLEGVTHMLCFNHQIVTGSVSQPAVSFGAHELAKRGKSNYRIFSQLDGSQASDSSDSGTSWISTATANAERRWDEANRQLPVGGTKLQDKKFNA